MSIITLDSLPNTVEELKRLPQSLLTDPNATAALTVAALHRYPQSTEDTFAMLDFLRGPRALTESDKQFIKERFTGKEYIMRSYFLGAAPENNYTPQKPYRVEVTENSSSRSELGYINLFVTCSGADSPRPVKVRHKQSTDQWFLWDQALLTGIKKPKEEDVWA